MFDRIDELGRFLEHTPGLETLPVQYRVHARIPPEKDYIAIVFWGWELILQDDGTWFCLDTSGG